MTLSPASESVDAVPGPHELAVAEKQIARLNRRLDRERRAREEAEGIADRRMRELWLANQELDQRVAEQTESIKAAYDLLERSIDAATRFVSNLSHEMLTPLNGIMGMLELIEQHSHTETLAGYVDTARQSTDRLHLLVRRLLDLVQLTAGLLRTNPVEFAAGDLIVAIKTRWHVRCLQSQKLLTVSSTIDSDRMIRADLERLLQIVDEVVDNARLHANPGVVTVEVAIDEAASSVRIAVADAGPGFTPDDTEGIFDTILRVDTSPGRATEGAGIGLGLAKELSRALGGTLEISSEPGSPTAVLISLPI